MILRKSKKSLEIKDIADLYAAVKETVECDGINIMLSPKSKVQIKSKLNQLFKEEETHQVLVCGTTNYLPKIYNIPIASCYSLVI